jgi:hypothetical protein
MKLEEARDILSDMRDQHLCFLGDSEIKEEWQKEYSKEAWACDSGAKALKKQIPMKLNNVKSILDFSGRCYTIKGDCPNCGAKGLFRAMPYCCCCGQKLDWGGSEKSCQTNLHQT